MSGSALAVFIARRLAMMVVVLLVLSLGVFTLEYLAPGSVEQTLLGTRTSTPEVRAAIRHMYHLDRSFLDQYWFWLQGAVHFDFGRSIRSSTSVTQLVGARAGLTLWLVFYAFMLMLLVALPAGIFAAVKRRGTVDRVVVGVSVMGVSAPAFATGLIALYLFAVLLGLFPAFGTGSGFFDGIWHLTLPALTLALTVGGLMVRFARAGMVAALEQDYVMFAEARGLSRRRILWSYALRNALVPIVTAGGIVAIVLLTGTVLVEVTFSLPGLGSLLVESVQFKDVPVIQAITLVFGSVIILVNLLVDIVYMLIDPRIRYERTAA